MKTILSSLLTLLLLISLSSFGFAEEKIYPCYKLTKEPVLDGKVRNDPAWENIPEATGFVALGSNTLSPKQTSFKMGYSVEGIYIGVECEEPEIENIKAKFKDMGNLWEEDSIEVFIFPKGAETYFQFIVNTDGARFNSKGLGGSLPLWDWQAKTYKGEDYWSAEVRIPFEVFGTIPKDGEVWTGNISRNILTSGDGDRHTTWAYLKRGFHETGNFGKIIFAGEFSEKEARKIEDKIINLLKKKIVANLESVSEYKTEISKKIGDYPSLRKEITSFLKNYEEIEKGLSQLNTIEEAQLLFKHSQNLPKEAEGLRRKILLEGFFN